MINRHVNISIRYPMFYLDLVEYALGRKLENLPHELLGSMFVCYARGYLPKSHNIIYGNVNNDEVDYVNFSKKYAIELTVKDKLTNIVHFNTLDSIDDLTDYMFLLTTRSRVQYNNKYNVVWIPFHKFIYYLTMGETIEDIYDRFVESVENQQTDLEFPATSVLDEHEK